MAEAIYYISLCGLKMFSSAQIGAHTWHIGNVLEHVCTFDVLSRIFIFLEISFLQSWHLKHRFLSVLFYKVVYGHPLLWMSSYIWHISYRARGFFHAFSYFACLKVTFEKLHIQIHILLCTKFLSCDCTKWFRLKAHHYENTPIKI